MSLGYSPYGAATISDAYGTPQPPVPGRGASTKSVTEDPEDRAEQLKALKARIHSSVGGGKKTQLGEFKPPPGPVPSQRIEIPDEPPASTPAPPVESAGGFPTTYTNAMGVYDASPQQESALLEKLNYAIHLLETQQDRKTATVTEELRLYTLLGMFIICVLDNFARAGRYVR